MIIWINGAYGAGKSSVAEILREKLPNSCIFDPENIGTVIRNEKPASLWKDDFQDYSSWRETVCCLLRELHESYDGTIIVPMSVVDPGYFQETIGRLEREGLPILHFVLLASAEKVMERIRLRGEDETCWCARQVDRCVQALGNTIRGIEIETDHKSPEDAAQEILRQCSQGENGSSASLPGLLHIYCGDGKGKTTAALGLALRAAGRGRKVLLLQFLKDGKSGEFASLSHVPNIKTIPQTRTFGFSWTLTPSEKAEAGQYYAGLLEAAFSQAAGGSSLLVLDEALGACSAGMLEESRLLELLDTRPAGLEVVLTGRGPSQALLDRADYVTEMKKLKHPYERGVSARPGIEY